MTRATILVLLLGGLLLLPAAASAQSSFVGVVTDNTGGVLPGVAVEVASPVLIEKIRTAVTDGQGRYSITQLRPGSYSFTFTLAGFGTVKREGVTLASDFTGTVNAQLQVGSLEKTITVSGQTPLADVQSAARTVVTDRELLDTLPTPRNTQSFGYLAPGVRLSKPDVGARSRWSRSTCGCTEPASSTRRCKSTARSSARRSATAPSRTT